MMERERPNRDRPTLETPATAPNDSVLEQARERSQRVLDVVDQGLSRHSGQYLSAVRQAGGQ